MSQSDVTDMEVVWHALSSGDKNWRLSLVEFSGNKKNEVARMRENLIGDDGNLGITPRLLVIHDCLKGADIKKSELFRTAVSYLPRDAIEEHESVSQANLDRSTKLMNLYDGTGVANLKPVVRVAVANLVGVTVGREVSVEALFDNRFVGPQAMRRYQQFILGIDVDHDDLSSGAGALIGSNYHLVSEITSIYAVTESVRRSLPERANDPEQIELMKVIDDLLMKITKLQDAALNNESKLAEIQIELVKTKKITSKKLDRFIGKSVDSIAEQVGPTIKWLMTSGTIAVAAKAIQGAIQ